MPPEGQADLAHPEAADSMLGNLNAADALKFQLHLTSCPHCQAAVAEFSRVSQALQRLPPAVEPPTGLEDRTIASVLAAVAQDRAATQPHQAPTAPPAVADDQAATQVHPSLAAGTAEAGAGTGAKIIRFPHWRSRLAAAAVAAAAVAAAVVVPLSLGGGQVTPALATVVIPLHTTTAAKVSGYGAATGRATARQDASRTSSWDITLTVHHLKHFDPAPWYECWYVNRKNGQLASAGTFLVPRSGSGTFSMTSGADPHDFSKMEITLQSPSSTGALAGTVILSGQARL